jgi:hypothetical protein
MKRLLFLGRTFSGPRWVGFMIMEKVAYFEFLAQSGKFFPRIDPDFSRKLFIQEISN